MRNKIREKIKILGYPLFSFKYSEDITPLWNDNFKKYWSFYIDGLIKWLKSEEQISDIKQVSLNSTKNLNLDRDFKEILGLIYYINKHYKFHEKLEFVFNIDQAKKGFKKFIEIKNRDLANYSKEFQIETKTIIKQIENLLPEEIYCWDETNVTQSLGEALYELKIEKEIKYLTSYYDIEDYHILISKFKKEFLKGKVKINLFFLASIIKDADLKNIIEKLAQLILKELPREEKRFLAENLSKNIDKLKRAFLEAKNILISWLKEKHKIELIEIEIEEILERISDNILDKEIEKIEKIILETSDKFDRIKAYRKLKQRWEELTSSPSPTEWSKTKNIPIEWILEGKDFDKLFNLLNSEKNQGTIEEYKKFIEFLEAQKEKIQILKNAEKINNIFLKKILNIEYDPETIKNSFIERIKKYLTEKSGIPVYEWKYNEEKIKKLAYDFLKENYKKELKEKVISKIENLSEKKAKIILKQIAEDPQIGLKLIKWLKTQ